MAPSKAPTSWDEEDSESTPPSSPPMVARRSKFDDEEEEDEVLESWDAAEDSEVELEKAKKAAEAKAKAEAEAKANHKSKAQRIEERRQANMRKKFEDEEEETSEDEDEDEAEKRARLREEEKMGDMKHAEDLFAGIGISDKRSAAKPVTIQEGEDPASAIDLSGLKLFNPTTAPQFMKLRDTLIPLLTANAKKPQYAIMMQEFAKQLVKDLSSDQIKKIASGLSTMSNEKMKEEKAAEKGGKKSKAAKTKSSLAASRDIAHRADTTAYNDGLDDGDFM